jgi:hypothetical protein
MLVAAAVCPHPPILVPEATGAGAAPDAAMAEELGRLRTACDTAVGTLLRHEPDLIAVVGGATRTADYPPDAAGSLRPHGVPFTAGHGQPVLPLSLTIARWLLDRRAEQGQAGGVTMRAIAHDASPTECLDLGARTALAASRVAMLVMGDGPGRRARGAPAIVDDDADRFDEEIAKALADADARTLAALDPARARALFAAGRAAWQVLAGAARTTWVADGTRFDATLHYAAVPFEVSYYVASWQAR